MQVAATHWTALFFFCAADESGIFATGFYAAAAFAASF